MSHSEALVQPHRPNAEPQAALMPNLFIIGASKCGTSALFAYLAYHPDIRMGDEKEPCYFLDQAALETAWPVMAHRPVSHDREAYLQNFAGGERHRYRGEGSTFYSQYPALGDPAPAIARAAPEARIIYVVREPVQRTIGHYWQEAKEFHEKRPLEQAIRDNPIYRDSSDYAMQLERYLAVFDRSQIHVVVSERLRSRREEVLAGILDWLELPGYSPTAEQLADRHTSPPTSRRERIPGVARLRDSPLWARAREVLPERVVAGLRRAGTRSFDKAEVSDAAVRAELRAYFATRTARFEEMIGERIPEWHDR